MFSSKLKLVALLLFLIGLYVMLNKLIIPLTFEAAKSDLFLDGSDDNGSLYAVSTPMSEIAFKHCNTYIEKELGDDFTPFFQSKPINAWDIGSYTFLVNGEIEIKNKEGVSSVRKYVCRIKYGEGDQNDIDNWSVYGISGVDEI